MGLLLRKGALDKEIIWNSYSYYIEHYWSMIESNIKEFRVSSKDNTYFENFAKLREEMGSYSTRKKASSQLTVR
jgi:ferric iron reductase protein FhuF